MKCSLRFAVSIVCLILVLFWFLKRHLEDIFDQYSGGSYFIDFFNLRFHPESLSFQQGTIPPENVKVEDKVIVMAKLEEEDTSWVKEELPDWQNAIYTVNPSKKSTEDPNILTTPTNKGHESMAYLSYIIDHYNHLPTTIAFLHSHRSGFLQAWHVDAPLHDNVIAMRTLRLDYVQHAGYVNLRCNWNPGCKKAHRINKHVTDKVWQEIFRGTSTPPVNQTSSTTTRPIGGLIARDIRPMEKPAEVGAACCAQFAVSRDQVLKRPLEDYIQFRNWVIETGKNDASSGRVMEFLWHIIFGMDAVFCPDEHVCYCAVYGRCQ
ncbi:hypothetical protein AJ79_00647 [Helicocarpus griseus UAMH5409]|uniref:Uncharacterized protein n=1 Tax=Helicocarpus griseus UAMH5409 TaxID=1447875 RepID=A0A2B7YBL5_9EURO|nr:hypothetical protein AJ79_00647 [Helicocarpus griseus UAMH5409]